MTGKCPRGFTHRCSVCFAGGHPAVPCPMNATSSSTKGGHNKKGKGKGSGGKAGKYSK